MRLMSEIKEELLELMHPDMVKALHDAYDKGYADGLDHCGDHEIEPGLGDVSDPVAGLAIVAPAPEAVPVVVVATDGSVPVAAPAADPAAAPAAPAAQ